MTEQSEHRGEARYTSIVQADMDRVIEENRRGRERNDMAFRPEHLAIVEASERLLDKLKLMESMLQPELAGIVRGNWGPEVAAVQVAIERYRLAQ